MATEVQDVSFPEIQWYLDRKLTHQIHTSERRAFRACRRRWNWVYRDMYHPQVTAEALEFGVAFHKAMETFYQPMTWLSPLEIRANLALVAFKQKCDRQLRIYKKLNPDPDVAVLESYKTRVELGLNMIKYYCYEMSPKYDYKWTPLRVEVSFEVPIKHPDHHYQLYCKCSRCIAKWEKFTGEPLSDLDKSPVGSSWRGLPVTYGGRLDALFQDELGRLWIADWKTTIRLLDEDAEASFLQLDDQVASYIWALGEYGVHISGFIYVEIKKTYPQPPELLSRKYKNKIVSTNKQHLTNYKMALKTIQEHDINAWQMGYYDDYLNWLKNEGPAFTQRNQIHKNTNEIAAIGEAIAREALDMIDEPQIYPQPGRFSCNWCMFKQPCLGKNMGEDYKYTLDTLFTRSSELYYEEEEASTE